MKRFLVLLILMIPAGVSMSTTPGKEIAAGINHVTVYPDRAQVNHEGKVEIPSGTTTLVLGDLSPYIDTQSIQVKGFGNFTILSVTHQNNYLQNLEDAPEVKNIRDQIKNLQLKVEDEKAAISVLKEKESFLVANRSILVKETTFSIEQLKNVMELYTGNMEQITTTILKKNRLIKEYENQIEALQKQIADKFGKKQLPSGQISVNVTAEKPLSARFSFSYVVTNAGWFPSYDLRVGDITRPVNLFYKANVFQRTGVEWKNVKLSFSNATPWISGNVPELNPWFIDYYDPSPIPRPRSVAAGVEKMVSQSAPEMTIMNGKKMEELDSEAMSVGVDKRVGETTVLFDIAAPYSIPSDGKIQIIEIQRTTTPAEYKYVTVPKLSPLAYLTGNITDWAGHSLIEGEATLYFENTFVGKSILNVRQLKDTLTVSLGTDNSILIKREKRQDFTSKKILGSNKTEIHSFLITIRNNKSNTVKIKVLDQIPVSSNSGIEVEQKELTGGSFNPQTGAISWELEIRPEETRELVMTYSVRYPKDKIVILE